MYREPPFSHVSTRECAKDLLQSFGQVGDLYFLFIRSSADTLQSPNLILCGCHAVLF